MSFVYVINMPHRTDRKEKFLSKWNQPDCTLIWYSVDDSNLVITPDLTKKEIGRLSCYNSHKQVLRKALLNNHFPLLILEDDAVMTEEQNLNTLMLLLPADKMIYFGALPVKDRKKYTGIIDDDVHLYGAHSYAFKNKEVAIFILENLQRPPIDSCYVDIRKKYPGKFGFLSRWIFSQDTGFSDIEQRVRKWS
jgi:hypothetical protein